MAVGLKTRNVPKLFVVWAANAVVFSGVLTGSLDIRDVNSWATTLSAFGADPAARWPYLGLLTLVSVFNGAFPRSVKERLVFWPGPRPGSRAFSHFLFSDSRIDRRTLEAHFGPLPLDPDEQNALWAKWLDEFADDARVRGTYGLYLLARDWTLIGVATLALAGPLALLVSDDAGLALLYGTFLLCQCVLALWVARVQGEELVMSVLACRGSSLPAVSGGVEGDEGA